MNQDRIELFQENTSILFLYSFHFVLYDLIFINNILIILNIFWDVSQLKNIFIFSLIIDTLLLLYPAIPLIFIIRIKLKPKITKIFQIISLMLIFLSLTLGILINITYWINLYKTTSFFSECPYNYNENSFDKLMSLIEENKNKENKIAKKCESRICFYISENRDYNFPYTFICNFNSENDFDLKNYNAYSRINSNNEEIFSNHLTECEKLSQNNYNNNKNFAKHFEFCDSYINNYYQCHRFQLPKKFNKNNFMCPSGNYNIYLYILGIILIILNILLVFIPWVLEYISFRRIYKIISEELNNNQQNIRNENRLDPNKTNNSSRNSANNNENININIDSNENNNEFRPQLTQTIIVAQCLNNNSNKNTNKMNFISMTSNKNRSESQDLINIVNNEDDVINQTFDKNEDKNNKEDAKSTTNLRYKSPSNSDSSKKNLDVDEKNVGKKHKLKIILNVDTSNIINQDGNLHHEIVINNFTIPNNRNKNSISFSQELTKLKESNNVILYNNCGELNVKGYNKETIINTENYNNNKITGKLDLKHDLNRSNNLKKRENVKNRLGNSFENKSQNYSELILDKNKDQKQEYKSITKCDENNK